MLSVVVTTQRANHNAATGSSDNPVTELCQSWNQRAPLLFIPRAEHNWVTVVKTPKIPRKRMAGAAGLEPVTSAVTGQRSNQLS